MGERRIDGRELRDISEGTPIRLVMEGRVWRTTDAIPLAPGSSEIGLNFNDGSPSSRLYGICTAEVLPEERPRRRFYSERADWFTFGFGACAAIHMALNGEWWLLAIAAVLGTAIGLWRGFRS